MNTSASPNNRWIAPLAALSSLVGIVVILFVLYNPLAFLPNHGLPIGYYSNHNRALSVLKSMEDVQVMKDDGLVDLTLEASWFTLRSDGADREMYISWERWPLKGAEVEDEFFDELSTRVRDWLASNPKPGESLDLP